MKDVLKNILNKIGLYHFFSELQLRIKFWYGQFFHRYLNALAKQQEKNPLSIPIIIISFNQLTYLKLLVDYLQQNSFKHIVIVDNNSTYEPLLNYLNELSNDVKVIKLNKNYGHKVFWEAPQVWKTYAKGYYVVTDPDILPLSNDALGYMRLFLETLNTQWRTTKVGFSLKTDDIPETNINREKIIEWEEQWRKNIINDTLFGANIDTTFALYRPKYHANHGRFLKGIRTAEPFIAKHLSWYIDSKNLTKEETYYMQHCSASSSWRVDLDGKLKDKRYD